MEDDDELRAPVLPRPLPLELLAALPLFPLEPADPLPETCWPTVRLTEATVPAIVEVRLASARFCLAVVSCDCAEVTAAWSESIWLVDAALDSIAGQPGLIRRQCLAGRVHLVLEGGRLTVASVWPDVTFWPTATSTAVTWPDTAKDRSACDAGSMVPDADTVCLMVPVPTVTFWVVTDSGAADASDELFRVAAQVISHAPRPPGPPPGRRPAAGGGSTRAATAAGVAPSRAQPRRAASARSPRSPGPRSGRSRPRPCARTGAGCTTPDRHRRGPMWPGRDHGLTCAPVKPSQLQDPLRCCLGFLKAAAKVPGSSGCP